MNHAVVMAGGSGTRFWPESRASRSKQFLDLTGKGPMIAETIRRLLPLFDRRNVWVVAGVKDASHLKARALGIPAENILLEPVGRNTAPAVALAVSHIARRDRSAVVAATPADHAVADEPAFRRTLAKGLGLARRTGRLVVLAIAPSHPATGYGYVERGAPFGAEGDGVYEVRRFVEKPDPSTARRFLKTGRFGWNSGIFLFTAAAYGDRLGRFLPEVHGPLEEAFRAAGTRRFAARLRAAFDRMPSISVDYGILEKEKGILVIPADFGWSDIGTWRSLHEFLLDTAERPPAGDSAGTAAQGHAGRGDSPADPAGNVTFGNVVLADCRNALVRTDRGVVALVGMGDVIVVRSGDAVLVCPRSRSEEVRKIAEEIRTRFPEHA